MLDLEHYLDVLERKPGALAGSTALAQWRQAGRWPESFDRLWHELNMRHGRQDGTCQMIELLQLGAGNSGSRLRAAVEQALALGCLMLPRSKLDAARSSRSADGCSHRYRLSGTL